MLYTVKPGETLWSIAEKFCVNPGEMIQMNDLEGLKAVYGGQSLVIPGCHERYQREIMGIYEIGPIELNSSLTSISPCWVEINETGTITTQINSAILRKAREKKVKVYLHIQNFSFNRQIGDTVIEKSQLRHKLIYSFLELVEEYGLAGVNLHLKNLSAYNRDYLSRFVQETALSLHPEGFGVVVTLPAKTGDSSDNDWGSYDYRSIGEYADYVILEVYDFHWAEGHAGPISPVFWVKDVLDYALLEIVGEKVILGIPCYGYDWVITGRQRGQQLTYQRAMERIKRYQAVINWDEDAATPYFWYCAGGENHQVWFENRDSLRYKLDLVKCYHLGGVALWGLGQEDAEIWSLFKKI